MSLSFPVPCHTFRQCKIANNKINFKTFMSFSPLIYSGNFVIYSTKLCQRPLAVHRSSGVCAGGYYFDYEAFGRELFMWDCDKGLIAVVLCPGKETVICSAVADTARPSHERKGSFCAVIKVIPKALTRFKIKICNFVIQWKHQLAN